MSRAAFARKHWERATQLGTPNATTTFHHLFNKRDFWFFSPTPGGDVTQYGARGKALGYLTKVRFVRYVRTPAGAELTGVDCSKPGSDAESEERIRVISGQFFELLVKYSRSHSHKPGDYGSVGRSRQLTDGSYCIFTGFGEALESEEFGRLRAEWKARYAPEPAPAPAPAPEPEPAPALALEPEPAPNEFDVKRVGFWSDDTWVRFLQQAEEECVAQYLHALAAEGEEGARTVSGCQIYADHSQFVVQSKRPVRASSERRALTTIFFKGILKKQCKFATLRMPTEGNLRSHFRWARNSGYPWLKFG